MMRSFIVVAIVYMMAGNDNKYVHSEPIEDAIPNHRVRHSRKIDDVSNTNDGIRPISFDPVVPEEPIPVAPPVDHGSSQAGLDCDNNGGCSNDSDGRRPVSFDDVKPQKPLPVPPPVEHGSSQAGLDKSPDEEHADHGKVSSTTPGVSTTEVSSTTKQVSKDEKSDPGRGHVVRPGCAPLLVLLNILLIFYYTTNII